MAARRRAWWVAALMMTCGAPQAPLRWELAGCAEVHADGTCELPADGRLTLWTERPTTVEIDAGGVLEAVGVDGGAQSVVQAKPGARWLRVAGGQPDRVGLRPPRGRDALDALIERARTNGAGVLAEIEAAGLQADPRALELRARLLARAGRTDEVLAAWAEAIAAREAAGHRASLVRDALALAWFQRAARAVPLEEIRRGIERISPLPVVDGDGPARVAYHLAQVERDAGQIRRALQRLDEAEVGARRLGDDKLGRDVLSVRGALLADLGRAEDARASLQRAIDLLPDEPAPCEEAERRTNAGWIALLAWEARRGPLDRASLERAAELYRTACTRPEQLANAEVNLALLALAEGRMEEAGAAVERARAASVRPSAVQLAWVDLVEARLAPRGAAVERWRDLVGRAEGAGLLDVAWRASSGLAEALEATGRTEEAIGAWQHAEALLDHLASLTPAGEGRDLLVGDRDRSARGLVDALLRAGRPEAALEAGRHARVRALWSMASVWRVSGDVASAALIEQYRQLREDTAIESADDWTLPTDEAEARRRERAQRLDAARQQLLDNLRWRPPAPVPLAELPDTTLVWLPLRDGIAAFSVVRGAVRATRLPAVDLSSAPEVLARALLAPFDEEIARAGRLRLWVTGDLRRVDVHALPWRGAPLGDQRVVAWTLDLSRPAPASRSGVLVAGDPDEDLDAARAEARAVAARHGVQPLLGEDITRAAMDEALRRVAIAHISGHGDAAGWQSAIRLAGGDAFDVTDVLTLPQVPEQIVLSACSTASDRGTTWDGAGLAHAFVLAGARQVVAAMRPVADTSAAALGEALHDPAHGTMGDIAASLQRARQSLRNVVPASDLDAWRVLEP